MRACQHCATPIPTSAKKCSECGHDQQATVGGESALSFPELQSVIEDNSQRDQSIARFSLFSLVGGAVLISLISGISVGSFVLGASAFFVALLALFILFQVIGIDVSV